MPWSELAVEVLPRNVMITVLVQRAALALLLTLAGWEPRGPNKGRKGRLNAFAPGLPTSQLLCPTAIPAQTL